MVSVPLPASMPCADWSTPSIVSLEIVVVCPSGIVMAGARLLVPGGRLRIVLGPVPVILTLTGSVTCVGNVPAPTWIVLPAVAHASAPATVANGLACEAAAHAGFDVAEADTYSVGAAPAAEAPAPSAAVHS